MTTQAFGPTQFPALVAETMAAHQPYTEDLKAEPENGIARRVYGLEARADPTVSLEEYLYWAKIERDFEIEENKKYLAARASSGVRGWFSGIFKKKAPPPAIVGPVPTRNSISEGMPEAPYEHEKSLATTPPSHELDPRIGYGEEWRQSARALRTASTGTIFFLVTTDILGWSGTP